MLKKDLILPESDAEFSREAVELFAFQHQNNKIYHQFCDLLRVKKSSVKKVEQIPFLPIEFFKSHRVVSTDQIPEKVFLSSGTTSSRPSKHFVSNISLYEKSFTTSFEQFHGKIEDYLVLALLPSYLERNDSSLVYMADAFIKKSRYGESGFFLDNFLELANLLRKADGEGKKILLLGVSFALLDFTEDFKFRLKNTIVMETGGMKGRRKELLRKELHQRLCEGFGIDKIHSEYGMTELLSQAYSQGKGVFHCPRQMKILIRDPEDPFKILNEHKTCLTGRQAGGINIIDLANINSCAFIATQDLGKKIGENAFEILGRFDNSDLRGCNLMAV